MREINIARIILQKRREKALTQDDLAQYMGVSKASVSKWETGQSYPDITFLPKLAAFFNISIDDLLGYEPQMSQGEIRRLYQTLAVGFGQRPFAEVLAECRENVTKYYACFPLLLYIGALLLNYCTEAGDQAAVAATIAEAKELFVRVKTESSDVELVNQARSLEAMSLLALGQPGEVLELFDADPDFGAAAVKPSTLPETLLASAFQLTGNTSAAKGVLQAGLFQYVLGVVNLLTSYLELCANDAALFEETYQRALAVAATFRLKSLNPSVLMTLYITAAQGYMKLDAKPQALATLGKYTDLVTGDIYPLRLRGDDYFNLLDQWLDNELYLGKEPPRDEKSIRRSMAAAVAENPVFGILSGEADFQRLVQRLKNNEEI